MKIFLLLAVLLLCGFLLSKFALDRPLLRGMGQEGASGTPFLVARARPLVFFKPADDMLFTTAAWCRLSPEARLSVAGDGRLWLATYKKDAGLLITALAEAEDPWHWEAAHHAPFRVLRQDAIPHEGETVHETLYMLAAHVDPFRPLEGAREDAPCLVYRAKLLLNFQRMQVIVEYHEAVAQERVRDMAYDLPYLNAFQQRARATCTIIVPGKNAEKVLPARIEAMPTADKALSRTALSRWTGEMQRRGTP